MGETQTMLLGALNEVFATRRAASSLAATPCPPGLQTRRAAALIAQAAATESSEPTHPVNDDAEVVSETEDETQGPEMTMPAAMIPAATSAELLEEMEEYILALRGSRAKDLSNCDKLQDNLARYKTSLVADKEKAQGVCKEMEKAQASLDNVRAILYKVVTDLGTA